MILEIVTVALIGFIIWNGIAFNKYRKAAECTIVKLADKVYFKDELIKELERELKEFREGE